MRVGDRLVFPLLSATVAAKHPDGSLALAFDKSGADFLAALEASGAVPLPPYIRGGTADAQDRTDYQTMFARQDGSVAAPTAGFHFTPELLERVRTRRPDGGRMGGVLHALQLTTAVPN